MKKAHVTDTQQKATNDCGWFSDIPDAVWEQIWIVNYARTFPRLCKRFRDIAGKMPFGKRVIQVELPDNPWLGVLHVHGRFFPKNVIFSVSVRNRWMDINQILEALCSEVYRLKGADFMKGIKCNEHKATFSDFSLCPGLLYMNLSRTSVEDITSITSCGALEYLYLDGTRVRDISGVSVLKNLKRLSLANTKILDISPISKCLMLEYLNLVEVFIIKDITPISHCAELQCINMIGAEWSVNSDNISAFSQCTKLERVYLADTVVSDISALSSCPNLNVLNIVTSRVTDIKAIQSCTGLQALLSRNAYIEDISQFSSYYDLQVVDILLYVHQYKW